MRQRFAHDRLDRDERHHFFRERAKALPICSAASVVELEHAGVDRLGLPSPIQAPISVTGEVRLGILTVATPCSSGTVSARAANCETALRHVVRDEIGNALPTIRQPKSRWLRPPGCRAAGVGRGAGQSA